jgi:hypothetical protein
MLNLPLVNISPKRTLVRTTGASGAEAGFGRQQIVLSRALCLYQRFDLRDIPIADRPRVAAMRISKMSPFVETGKWMVWSKSELQSWIWDQGLLAEKGLKGVVVPETLLHEAPDAPRARLVKCLEGLEGQVWEDGGRLIASHWWSDTPEATSWERFCRRAEVKNIAVPEPEAVALRGKPWASNSALRETLTKARQGQLIWLVLLTMGLLLGMELGNHFRLRQLNAALQADNDHLAAQIEPILLAREQTLDDIRVSRALLQLWPPFRQLELMSVTAQKLPRERLAEIRGWHYAGDELRVTFYSENPDPSQFVKSFEEMEHFAAVSSEPETNTSMLTLKMRIADNLRGQGR